MKRLKAKGIEATIYEPAIADAPFFNPRVVQELDVFKAEADDIIANLSALGVADVTDKVFT